MAVPLINGINYHWGQVTLILFGLPVIGITKISYKRAQKKENNYGFGYEPISRGYGNITYEASIEIYMDTLKSLIEGAPNNDILAIGPFDVQVVYANASNVVKTDVLKMCEFMEVPADLNQDDTKFLVTIPLIIAGIEHKQ